MAGAVPFLRGDKIRLLRLFQPFATAGKAAMAAARPKQAMFLSMAFFPQNGLTERRKPN